MQYIYSFLFCGVLCLIAQLILDNTKLTAGHITSIFVVIGSFLDIANIYDKIIEFVGAGATTPIINFGNSLYTASLMGFKSEGFLGIFSKMLDGSCVILSSVIVFSFIFTLFSYPKD